MLVVAALMAGSLLLAACGGEEELDLDEYFQRFEDIKEDADARVESLPEKYAGVGEDIEATRDYFNDANAIIEQALNDLKDLQPPAEARDAHDEFVAAGTEMLASLEDFSGRFADVESPAELQTLLGELDEPPFSAAAKRVDNACRQLQGIADESGIEVDLGCE